MIELNHWVIWLSAVSAVMFVATLVALPIIIVRLPVDYFCDAAEAEADHSKPVTTGRMLTLLIRNVLGWLLLAAGVLMLFLPGQGLVTIIFGMTLVDFPAKKRLMRRMMARVGAAPVITQMNRIRHRFERPPLKIPAQVER